MGTTELDRAREEIQRASERADGETREQLLSIDEGLMEEMEGDKTDEGPSKPDRLEELAEKLDGLSRETEDQVRRDVESAHERIERYVK